VRSAGCYSGSALLLVGFRRSSLGDPRGDGALFLVLLAPCVFLYGTGFLAARATGATRPWAAVFLVFGTLLVPAALFQLLEWLGGNADAPLNGAWIFLLTAGAAKAASCSAGLRTGC
jgi:hypothetical protein